MTDNIITRLRASPDPLCATAADALEWQVGITKALQERCDKQAPDQVELRQERDELKATLAKSEQQRTKITTMLAGVADEVAVLKRERDALVKKLAEAKAAHLRTISAGFERVKERDEARAEAAALREALITARTDLASAGRYREADKVSEALSQPGPGAALLEQVKKLKAEAAALRDENARLLDEMRFMRCRDDD